MKVISRYQQRKNPRSDNRARVLQILLVLGACAHRVDQYIFLGNCIERMRL